MSKIIYVGELFDDHEKDRPLPLYPHKKTLERGYHTLGYLPLVNWYPSILHYNYNSQRKVFSNNASRFIASISLDFEKNVSREDIDCPNDVITYNCSIQTNSENIFLLWEFTFPNGMQPQRVMYNSSSTLQLPTTLVGMGFQVRLTDYVLDKYIESVVEVTLIMDVDVNRIVLGCSTDIADAEVTVIVNTSG